MTGTVSLVVPASSERMLAKAQELEVYEVILDLEDSVAPDRKREALALAISSLASGFAASRVSVRVNPPRSPWAHDELSGLASAPVTPASIVIPKVSDPGDLQFAERLLAGAEAAAGVDTPIRLQALLETAGGVACAREIAGSCWRLEALILGYADLAVSLSRLPPSASDLQSWRPIQDLILVAARSMNLRAIDGPFFAIDDRQGLTRWAQHVAGSGFDGKWAIHPDQLDPIRIAFMPDDASIARAQAIVSALREAQDAGAGAVSSDGEMIDEAIRLAALRTLERAGLDAEPAS